MHKTYEAVLSLCTGNPSTDDNFAVCSLERTPSNKLNFPYPDIISKIIYTIYTIYRRQSFHRSCRNSPSLNLTALRAVLRITAPRTNMSDYENKRIPQKTGLASYLVSKSHGSEVLNCRDQRVFFSLVTIAVSPLNFRRRQQEKKPLSPSVMPTVF